MKSTIEHLGTWDSNSKPQICRPTGITVLGILEIISGVLLATFAALFGAFSGMIGTMMSDMMPGMVADFMGVIGGILAVAFGILAAISFLIAWALFSAKRWARTIVIVFAIIDVALQAASLVSGNAFGIASMILDGIILYYMWRPHVISYFNK